MEKEVEDTEFDTLYASIADRLSRTPSVGIEAEIENALRQVIELFHFERSTFAEFTMDGGLNILCSVAREGIQPFPSGPAPAFLSWYVSEVAAGKIVSIKSEKDLPPQATGEAAYLRWSGLRSHLGIPLSVGGRLTAGVGFATFRSEQRWTDELVRQLKLIGQVLALSFARKRAEENLIDALQEIERLKPTSSMLPDKVLQAGFGLTPAEARIAVGIARGETLSSLAQTHGVTIATVRTQLKSVFSKMGAHRQAEILLLLAQKGL